MKQILGGEKLLVLWWVHTKILLLSETHPRPTCLGETHLRPRYATSETDRLHRRPTCLIGDPSQTDMTDWRPITDRHAWLETHHRPTWLRSLIGISTHLNILILNTFCLFINHYIIYWNNILGHVGFRWVSYEACRGLRSGMLVSNGSLIGLQRISDRAEQRLVNQWKFLKTNKNFH